MVCWPLTRRTASPTTTGCSRCAPLAVRMRPSSPSRAYQYYQIDESAQELTRRYRLEHPHDNREALKIHVHPLGEGG